MRYAVVLSLLLVSLLLANAAFAQVSLDDKGIANVFSIYSAGDKYIALGLDSNNYVLLGVLDSNLTPLKAYNLSVKATTYYGDNLVWALGADYGYVWFFNETGSTVDALFYNVSSDKFYRFYLSITGLVSKPPTFDLEVFDAEAAEYVAAVGMLSGAAAGDTSTSILLYIVKSLEGVSQVLEVSVNLGTAFSSAYEFQTIPAVLVEKDVVYFAFVGLHNDTPAVFYGFYNVSSLSGKLFIADGAEVANYVTGNILTYSYMIKDDNMLHIASVIVNYYTLWYVVVNASDMSVVDSKIIRVYGEFAAPTPYGMSSARTFNDFMVIPIRFSALLIDTASDKVYLASLPAGAWSDIVTPESLGGVGFYDNGSIYLVRPTSIRDYLRGVYRNVVIYNVTDGIDDVNVTVGDYSEALNAVGVSAEHGLVEVSLPSADTFSISLEPITYYPAVVAETVTKTVTEAVPVPYETTVTETVTTTVAKEFVTPETLITILFILLMVAAFVLLRRR